MRALSKRAASLGATVFSEFSALAVEHGAVNLGQGFPDFDGPEEVKEAAQRAIRDGVNQYAISRGSTALREAIAKHSARFYGVEVDPETMVGVTSGATEAIFDAILGLVDPGDDVVLFEPFYDSYLPAIAFAGGTPRVVTLRAPGPGEGSWSFDADALAATFGPRTRLLILNSPHNPTGKVFTADELTTIAALCVKHDVVALTDEVYEHLTFGLPHLRLASFPGMAERTVTVSSAGKSFSFTGWKVGWAIAPPPLLQAVQRVHQYVTFATASPFQAAAATALTLPDSYFSGLIASYLSKRDRLSSALEQAGLRPLTTEGTYFLIARIPDGRFTDDLEFCRYLTREVKVAAIPPSAFYLDGGRSEARQLARFAFCKTDAVLDLAAERLAAWARNSARG